MQKFESVFVAKIEVLNGEFVSHQFLPMSVISYLPSPTLFLSTFCHSWLQIEVLLRLLFTPNFPRKDFLGRLRFFSRCFVYDKGKKIKLH